MGKLNSLTSAIVTQENSEKKKLSDYNDHSLSRYILGCVAHFLLFPAHSFKLTTCNSSSVCGLSYKTKEPFPENFTNEFTATKKYI